MHRGFSTALTTTVIAGVIVLVGVVGYLKYGKSQSTPDPMATTTNATASLSAQGTSSQMQLSGSWETYENTAYGFSFQHPSNRTAYSEADAKNRELTAASPRVQKVSIAQDEFAVFCCEPLLLTFTIKDTSKLDIDETLNFEQTTINGYPALLVEGDGGLGDVFKKMYFQLSESQWLVVNQNAESDMLDEVLSTLAISGGTQTPYLAVASK